MEKQGDIRTIKNHNVTIISCPECGRPVNQSGEDVLVKGVKGEIRQEKATCYSCSVRWMMRKGKKQGDITNNYFEREFGQSNMAAFCRTGLNSPHNPWREHFVDFVEDGDSFLDVGCGSGADWEILRRCNKRVVYRGVDYAPSIVLGAMQLCPGSWFGIGDINALTEKDGSWDVVNCRHVLNHCEYYERPIKELLRVARKRVILTLHHGFPADDTDHIRYNDPYSWDNLYSKTKFMEFLKSLPMTVECFEENHRGSPEVFIVLKKK